ncbi:MAG: hypothetical protein L0287_23355 [Anaerolineae bacterium]|nr:hypothetical protein [Anaerolineae bacterium]MCI0609965.1 hypothetical protein [Anaerolineae bacterium]
MKLVYAVSQWTNSKRPPAQHLDNGEGKPLCGGNGRQPLLWAMEEGEPTCKICQDLALMIQGETDEVGEKRSR